MLSLFEFRTSGTETFLIVATDSAVAKTNPGCEALIPLGNLKIK